ncbi:alkaline phosphatase [Methylomonas sp. SURF-2]|uniref:Alkaline phosphatase n=1 Tax=Methylomonas subterranea TaxID=2952225 RepID=A0ABT1TDH2_9GAMM|nr:alkaline phosphatase [Methylomonas sp. SURF-2]MCQ8103490.1 alkaline phosphatase [Methylomonas sp. SURF-2]
MTHRKTPKTTALAVAMGVFGLSLSVGVVAHGDKAKKPANQASDQVPSSAAEWFKAGQNAVLVNKKDLQELRKAKNVILFVGDGMGVSTVTATRILEGQMAGRDGEFNRLSFERFSHMAHSVTASANQQTSDSAPTATAMVAGIKTNDGAISVDQSINRLEPSAAVTAAKSVKTILERAEERGLSTGVVSTARFTHATPAVNYAHISNRDWEADSNLPAGATVKDIARQLLEFPYGDGLEVALGGGRSYFMPNSLNDPEYPSQKGRRADGRDLTLEWISQYNNSEYVWNQAQFDAVNPKKTDHLLGLFERSHMRYEADRKDDAAGEPSLAEMTDKAIKILQKNKKGYYLMVEAGRIDHAHHAGNAYRALTDTIALSDAVKKARELTNDKDTLILVTADHSHVFTIAGYPSRGNPILGKTAVDGVELKDSLGLPYTTLSYANGPGWTGGMQRKEFNPANEGTVAAAYDGGKLRPDLASVDTENPNYLQEATVPMGSETHAGEDVAIYADGPGAYLVRGTLEQNAIYHVMADALGMRK